jgi:hypothetical protein
MADKQSPMYKKPSEKQRKDIEKARKKTREGMEGEKDILSKFSTTMAKAARDQTKQGRKDMERIPEEVRRYEAEEGQTSSTYKKGGMVKSSASKRADGIAIKGKTRGKMV